ncbi:ATP-grasp fold amidoligase family protein [Azotobacter sp. CWF10]
MLDIAKRLSAPFGYLRVDCYRHDGKIYVGELTITPAAGAYRFLPPEWDLILGSKFGWPEDPPPAWPIGKLCNLP